MNRCVWWEKMNSVTAAGLSILLLLAVLVIGPAPAAGDEARCAWFSRYEWSTRQDIVDEMANIAACNMNAVLFQIRGEADAFYISKWEPWAEQLGPGYPGYDPLAVAIYEAHKRGLELHAYVNAFPAWSDTSAPLSPFHIYNAHPEWIMVNSSGVPMDPDGPYGYAFASPGIPQFREHLNRVIMDIVTYYDVDGIHLDYIRYPYYTYSYDDSSLARFERQYGHLPTSHIDPDWKTFRRSLVGEVVAATYDSVTALKPWVKVSAAVWGWYYYGYNDYLQDSHGWLDSGFVDFTAPMIYLNDPYTFQTRLHDHAVAKYGRHVYGGIGLYLGFEPDTLLMQIDTCRSEGVDGQAIFSATDLYGTYKTALIGSGGPYESPADMPDMAWKASKPFTVSVALPVSTTQVDVLFSSNVDEVTGQDVDNYIFDSGLLTISATRDVIDHRLVHLITGTHYDDFLYTLTVTGVQSDGSKETVSWPNNQRQFYGKSSIPPPGFIVDNEDTTKFSYIGYWRQSVVGDCWNWNKHYHARGGGDSTATWTTAIDSAGNYAVFYWVNYSNYTADAHYLIHTVAGPDSAIGDQYYEERWNYLGTFPFSDTARVTVTNYFTTGNYVIADAIQWVYVSPISSTAPPAAVTDLASYKSGADIVLVWSAVTSDTSGLPETVSGYIIYRNSDPSSTPTDSIGSTSNTAYTDPGAAGNTATNYFYVVRAVNEAQDKSAASNLVGEFDRQLMIPVKGAAAKKTKDLR